MRLQFDGNQLFQLRAIESVADLLRGQPRNIVDFSSSGTDSFFGPVRNRLDLDDSRLLENLQVVQRQNGIAPDASLQTIEETIRTIFGDHLLKFPNFSVEMETGTGKTYVYIRISALHWS